MENVLDIYGRQYNQLISYEEALKKFNRYLAYARMGPTSVYEVKSFSINNVSGLKSALDQVPRSSAIWQHTDKWHVAAIYIPANTGFKFSRKITNLFSHGIVDKDSFRKAWIETNGNYEYGVFPKKPGDAPSNARVKQASYIVADRRYPENEHSKIPGSFKKNETHRTHLISSQITGIEHHRGLLIDFDGWLNSNPMNQFETKVLNMTKEQDIVWSANIWIGSDNYLHWKYLIYDKNYHLITEKEWIDDRWTYIWRFDRGQEKLSMELELNE